MITATARAPPVSQIIGSPCADSDVAATDCRVRAYRLPWRGAKGWPGTAGSATAGPAATGLELIRPPTESQADDLGRGVHHEREREQRQGRQEQRAVLRAILRRLGHFLGDQRRQGLKAVEDIPI